MYSLDQDLQSQKQNLRQFYEVAIRVLNYLPNVISRADEKSGYTIYSSDIAGTKKFIRPVNNNLFIKDTALFRINFERLESVFQKIVHDEVINEGEKKCIDSTLYTIQQSIGAGMDLLVNDNSARKHVGNRFEELIKAVFTELKVVNKKLVLQIPYETDEGSKIYKCENDLILSPFDKVVSTTNSLDDREIVVGVKTTSKDRLGKMFIDKMLLEGFVKHPQKVIGIFLNDVQRKSTDNISFTLVSGLFMVYTKFLTVLDGVYYIDPPPNALKKPYSNYIKKFSDLISHDYKKLLGS